MLISSALYPQGNAVTVSAIMKEKRGMMVISVPRACDRCSFEIQNLGYLGLRADLLEAMDIITSAPHQPHTGV